MHYISTDWVLTHTTQHSELHQTLMIEFRLISLISASTCICA